MKIEIEWLPLIPLRGGRGENFIFKLDDLDVLSRSPGVYVFGRKMGGHSFVPVYIGQAARLRGRIKGQLNNVRLMMALKNAPGRRSFLAVGKLIRKPGQEPKKALNIVERALIEYALAQEFEIVNVMGTKRSRHSITSLGRRQPRRWLPKTVSVEKRR